MTIGLSPPAINIPRFFKGGFNCRERQQQRQRRVLQRHSAVTGVPSRYSFALGVDDKHDSANLRRGQQASSTRRQQKLSANSLALRPAIHSQARQAEPRHFMKCQASPYDLRRPGIVNRGGAEAVKAENSVVAGIVNRKERFRAAQFMTFAGVTT